jgi:hypothetical protein
MSFLLDTNVVSEWVAPKSISSRSLPAMLYTFDPW